MCFSVVLLVVGCGKKGEEQPVAEEPAADVEADVEEIKKITEAWDAAFNAGDIDMFIPEVESVVEDFKASGELAYARGTWSETSTSKANGESFNYNGNWVFILQKRSDQSWKITCETYSIESLIYPPPPEKDSQDKLF
jgi:ketosteroid isomerase-like protein